jgi:hypothetical protein
MSAAIFIVSLLASGLSSSVVGTHLAHDQRLRRIADPGCDNQC